MIDILCASNSKLERKEGKIEWYKKKNMESHGAPASGVL